MSESVSSFPFTRVAFAGLPRLVKLYVFQVAIGFGLSAVFVGLLLGFDIVGLRSLILSTQGGAVAALLLFLFNGLVFAGVQFAITIMLMSDHAKTPPGGGRRMRVKGYDPSHVRVIAGE